VRVITSTPHKALLVPEKAIRSQVDGVPHVGVINERNKVDIRKVEVGLHYDGMRVVTAGLSADDWVVAEMWPLQPPLQ
jgi:multidrug efflux pump subunit AcrA (membrane-fusion protein)